MKVIIFGASGFIGSHLSSALDARGDDVVAASLRDTQTAAATATSCDAIVNLAGEPIAQRWSTHVKREIEESRVESPRRFLQALAQRDRSCKVYVSASAVGYYGTSDTQTFVEESPPGSDFLARVCVGWEREAGCAADLGMRVAIVRTGIVLGSGGGALGKILPAFRMGMGGIIGTGRQWLSWIHVTDLIQIYLMAIDRIEGPVNACAPNPVTNAEFTTALSTRLNRPARMKVPTLALRAMLGEGAEMLLSGQRVMPKRTQELGYAFRFPQLKGALTNLL